jgi:hypothetical protein
MATRIADNPKIWGRTPSQGPEDEPIPTDWTFRTLTYYGCPNCGCLNSRESQGTCQEEDCGHDLSQYSDYDPNQLSGNGDRTRS